MTSHLVSATCDTRMATTRVVVPCPPLSIDTVTTPGNGHIEATVNGAFLTGPTTGQTVQLDWGDGTAPDTGTQPQDTSQGVEFTHTYTATGTYTLTASVPAQPDCPHVQETVVVTVTAGPALAAPDVGAVSDGSTAITAQWAAVPNAVTYTATANPGNLAGVVGPNPDIENYYMAQWSGLTPDTVYTIAVVAHAPGFTDSPPGGGTTATPPVVP